MRQAKVVFREIHQNIQITEADKQEMTSRIYFDLELDDNKYEKCSVDIKQIAGSEYETAPLEVGAIKGYSGPFNHDAFRKEVEAVYRKSFGSAGSAISFGKGAIVMRNNRVFLNVSAAFDVPGKRAGW